MAQAGETNTGKLGRRVVVIGTTGSGKTTLARQLGERLGVPHVELDALHWGPGWTSAPVDVFRERTAAALRGDCWTVDGNYSIVRDLLWSRADTVIWLDYSFPVTFGRLLRRTLRRCVRREELWNGNRERLAPQLFSRDSLLWWCIKTYGKHRRAYPALFAQPEHAHLTVFQFRIPRATASWLRTGSASEVL